MTIINEKIATLTATIDQKDEEIKTTLLEKEEISETATQILEKLDQHKQQEANLIDRRLIN